MVARQALGVLDGTPPGMTPPSPWLPGAEMALAEWIAAGWHLIGAMADGD